MDSFTIDVATNAAHKAMESLVLAIEIVPNRDKDFTGLAALLFLESRAKTAIDGMVANGFFPKDRVDEIREIMQASDAAQFTKILAGELSK